MALTTADLRVKANNDVFTILVDRTALTNYLADPEHTPIGSVVLSDIFSTQPAFSRPSASQMHAAFGTTQQSEIYAKMLANPHAHVSGRGKEPTRKWYRPLVDALLQYMYPYAYRNHYDMSQERAWVEEDLNNITITDEMKLNPLAFVPTVAHMIWDKRHQVEKYKKAFVTVPDALARPTRKVLGRHGQVVRQSRPVVRRGGMAETRFETSVSEDDEYLMTDLKSTAGGLFVLSSGPVVLDSEQLSQAQHMMKQVNASGKLTTGRRGQKGGQKGRDRDRKSKQHWQQSWTTVDE